MYYTVSKNGEHLQGYTDPQYKGGYSTIEHAAFHCGEGGHVEDESGKTI